jgi:hypothetical protein
LSNLQASYTNLLSALGDSNSTTSLGTFLQTLSSNLPSNSSSGNAVRTSA